MNNNSIIKIDNNNGLFNNKEIIKDNKSELTIDFIMIIGKYLNRTKDFINLIKVKKNFKDLLLMYHFNPMSDFELFENIETLVIYNNFFNYNNINVEDNIDLLYNYILNKINKYFRIIIEYKLTFSQYKTLKEILGNNYYKVIFKNVIYTRRERRQFDKLNNDEKNHEVPEGVTILDDNCFEGSKVINIKLPSTLKEIKENSFNKCKYLENVEITNIKVVKFEIPYWIGKLLKKNNIDSIKYVYTKEDRIKYFKKENNLIPENVIRLSDNCFRDSNITSIEINEGIKSIGEMCFFNCKKLTKIKLPSTLRELGKRSFENCISLKELIIPNGITIIPFRFCACSGVKTINLPQSINVISFESFSQCENLENINIPNGIKSIGSACFEKCISLITILIPSSLRSLPERCFDECYKLKDIEIENKDKNFHYGNNCFNKCFCLNNKDLLIY